MHERVNQFLLSSCRQDDTDDISVSNFEECIIDLPPETLSLLPMCIAIIDCGDICVVRAGDGLEGNMIFEGICDTNTQV